MNEVNQSHNQVGGDQAGRDIHKPTYNFSSSQQSISTMKALLQKYEDEKDRKEELNEFIEELNYYNSPLDGEVLGLEKKLKEGNRDHLVAYAIRAKEKYFKKLLKYQFSEAAQKIHVYLLALVESNYMNNMYAEVCNGKPKEQIDLLIQQTIINPILNELEDNALDFTAQEINGMLYFLTGNCHIKWSL